MRKTRLAKITRGWTAGAAAVLLTGCVGANQPLLIDEEDPETPSRQSAAIVPTAGVVVLEYGLIPLAHPEPAEPPDPMLFGDFSDLRPRGGATPKGATSDRPWPQGIIPLRFDSDITSTQRNKLMQACRAWEATGVITCTVYSDQDYWLDVMKRDNDCYATRGYYVREDAPQKPYDDNVVNIGKSICWQTDAILIHEFGHAVGLAHEHQRSDRDAYIALIDENLASEHINGHGNYSYSFTVLSEVTSETAYDFQSIMHYPYCRHAKAPGLTTIVAKPGYASESGGNATCWHPDQGGPFGGYGLKGQTVTPTASDLEAVRLMYEREPEPPKPPCTPVSFGWPTGTDASHPWHFEWRDSNGKFALCDYVHGYAGYRANVEFCGDLYKPTVAFSASEIRVYNTDTSLRGRARPEGGDWTPWQYAVDDASWTLQNGIWIWTLPAGASGRWDFEWWAAGGQFNWGVRTSLCGYVPGTSTARSANLFTCSEVEEDTVSPPRVTVHPNKLILDATLATEGRLNSADVPIWELEWLPLAEAGGWRCED